MDIARYVGEHLIRYEYCYLPGIGNLEIRKKSATYNKDTNSFSAPEYDVMYTNALGSIDDSFANFVANNERISIAHAANEIKDFCTQTKIVLKEGKEVEIPGIGKFVYLKGAVDFLKNPDLEVHPKKVPYFKHVAHIDNKREPAITEIIRNTEIREPKSDEEIIYKPATVNWGKIAILGLIVIIVLSVGFFVLKHFTGKQENADGIPTEHDVNAVTAPIVEPEPEVAQVAEVPASTPANAVESDGTLKFAINEYPTEEQAVKRVERLNSYGNKVTMVKGSESQYFVIMSIVTPLENKDRISDSLRRMFNPNGKVTVID